MAGRMSNRDRIAHLRAEADATAKEKAEAKAAKAAQPAKPGKSSSGKSSSGKSSSGKAKAAAPTRRVRFVWSVCDPSGKEVKQFPYAQEQEARAEAQQMTATSGRTHFVTKGEVSVG